jgi:Na+/H+ antiporter NhaA
MNCALAGEKPAIRQITVSEKNECLNGFPLKMKTEVAMSIGCKSLFLNHLGTG